MGASFCKGIELMKVSAFPQVSAVMRGISASLRSSVFSVRRRVHKRLVAVSFF